MQPDEYAVLRPQIAAPSFQLLVALERTSFTRHHELLRRISAVSIEFLPGASRLVDDAE